MKRLVWLGTGVVALAMVFVGCNWDTGSDADSWSSAYDWVNFSGTYRAADGGILTITTEQSSTETTTTTGTGQDNTNRPTAAGTANGSGISRTVAQGTLSPGDIVPGSVGITLYFASGAPHSSYGDDGAGNLTGGLAPGVIIYRYGSWRIDLSSIMGAPDGGSWRATYRYYVEEPGSSGGEETSTTVSTGGSGSTSTTTTSDPIYFYTVQHKGQYVTLVDDSGRTYSGRISKIQSASGAQNTDIDQVAGDEEANDGKFAKYTYYESPLPANGDQVIASFECTGSGGKIVGTLSGLVNLGVLAERRLDATLISGGTADDINAIAPAVTITVQTAIVPEGGTTTGSGTTPVEE